MVNQITPDEDDERALPPAEMLRLLQEQEAAAVRRLTGEPYLFYAAWGLAWFVGFGALFLHYGLSGEPYLPISRGVALAVLFSAMALALAVTVYAVRRSAVHVRGVSQDRGMMYGFAWAAGFAMVVAIAVRFGESEVSPSDDAGLLWAALSLLVVSVLYMAGAALWREWSMFWVGVWLCALNVVGTVAGPGWHALLTSVGGGGGFLVTAWLLRRRMRAPR